MKKRILLLVVALFLGLSQCSAQYYWKWARSSSGTGGTFVGNVYNFDFENTDYAAFLTASGWSTGTTAPVLSTTQKHAGAKALYFSDVSGYADTKINSPTISKSELYGSMWVYVAALPPYGVRGLITVYAESGAMELRILASGAIAMYVNYSGVGNTTTTLPTNTWTQIKFHAKWAGASSVFEVKIGAETYTDNSNVTAYNVYQINMGIGGEGPETSYYIDDVIMDDAQYPN